VTILSWKKCSNTKNNMWENSNNKFTGTLSSHSSKKSSWASGTSITTWTFPSA
jgi:hypothetical protein